MLPPISSVIKCCMKMYTSASGDFEIDLIIPPGVAKVVVAFIYVSQHSA